MQQPAKKRAANIPFWKRCKVKSWGLYRNCLQRPENGAGEAMPPNFDSDKKEKHHTSYEVQCFFGGEYRDRTGDLLHAMQALSQLS